MFGRFPYVIICVMGIAFSFSPLYGSLKDEDQGGRKEFKLTRIPRDPIEQRIQPSAIPAPETRRYISPDDGQDVLKFLADQPYESNINEWHKIKQKELETLDKTFNPKVVKYRENIALCQICVTYSHKGKMVTKSQDFRALFVSGRTLALESELVLGSIKDFSETYEVIVRPTDKQKQTQRKPVEATVTTVLRDQTFLSRSSGKLPLDPICIDDYFPTIEPSQIDPYREQLVQYFGLRRLVQGHNLTMQGYFITKLNGLLPQLEMNPELKKQIGSLYVDSLKYAPFDSESEAFVKRLFGKEADAVFGISQKGCVRDNFRSFLCDSEQSIRLLFSNTATWDEEKLKKHGVDLFWENLLFVDEDGKIVPLQDICQIIVNIASFRYMCNDCVATYYYDLAVRRHIQKDLYLNLLQRMKGKLPGIEEQMQGLRKEEHELLNRNKVIVFVSGGLEHKK